MNAKKEDLPQLDFENQVCFPLYSAANAVVRAYRPLLQALDLTYLQYMAMMVLWAEQQLSVKELGERLLLDSGTLTPLLKRLAGKGYVERSRSEQDERVRLITVTREGMDLRARAGTIPLALACNIGLSREDSQQLKHLCEQILSGLDNDQSPTSKR